MSLTATTIDAIQASLYTGLEAVTITGLTYLSDFPLRAAEDPFAVDGGSRACDHGGFTVTFPGGSSLSYMPAASGDPYSIQWMMEHPIRIRVGVDISTCRAEVAQSDLLGVLRQVINAVYTILQPAAGTPRNLTRLTYREPYRSTIDPGIVILEVTAILKEPWGRA